MSYDAAMIKLFHHPFSRAAGVVWALEEVGEPYELIWTDLRKGEHKGGEVAAPNVKALYGVHHAAVEAGPFVPIRLLPGGASGGDSRQRPPMLSREPPSA